MGQPSAEWPAGTLRVWLCGVLFDGGARGAAVYRGERLAPLAVAVTVLRELAAVHQRSDHSADRPVFLGPAELLGDLRPREHGLPVREHGEDRRTHLCLLVRLV